jgi:endonuclease III
MNKEKRTEIFSRFQMANPEPKTELEYSTPFELLAAVLLSAQATDKSVNIATRKLFAVANTPASIAALGVEGVESHIRTIGLFRSKAKHLVQTSEILRDKYSGEVPADREALESLPGVGRKTANVVLNTAFGQPTMAVDTHIFRISNRTGIAPGKDVLQVEKRLLRLVPQEYMLNAHHWLILHGRYVCKARTPECSKCSIVDLCEFKKKNI